MEVTLLLADPHSDNMAAFCWQDKCTDCKSHGSVPFLLSPVTLDKDNNISLLLLECVCFDQLWLKAGIISEGSPGINMSLTHS